MAVGTCLGIMCRVEAQRASHLCECVKCSQWHLPQLFNMHSIALAWHTQSVISRHIPVTTVTVSLHF